MAERRWEGLTAIELAARLGVPAVSLHDVVPSTMDVANRLADAGAAAGTLVLAEMQTAGRGRGGRAWVSPPGSGIWLTMIERPNDPAALEVLSLRLGLRAARALDRYATAPVRLKWPNDLFVDDRKLAGILVEARWRDGRPDWVEIGFGLNVGAPVGVSAAAGLHPGAQRLDVLEELVPAIRAAAAARGALTAGELAEYAQRDRAAGRRCRAPGPGVVVGISATGALRVASGGAETTFRGGSLVLEEEA